MTWRRLKEVAPIDEGAHPRAAKRPLRLAELSPRTFCTFAREFSPFTVLLAPPAGPDLTAGTS
ncbi:MAG TPA: hypothetical protein VMS04_02670, partial [Vicinamibacterales bacterium]|nr:hypothetical protein [Vicinamibacterales bacterium]